VSGTQTRTIDEIVEPGAAVERVASGFTFTEGPIWMPDGSLHFSDMPADKRRRWHPADGVSVLRDPSNKCNGMTLDADGALYVCEHATSRLVRETPDGATEVLAARWEGRELNSPNDVIVAGDGSVLFSDPSFGRMPGFGVERDVELPFRGVFRVPPDGGPLQCLADDFGQPNGLCFSPDESLLYVNDTGRAHIRVFEVAPDRSLGAGRIFADGIASADEAGDVDGMKVDERGNVYVTGPGGIWVFTPGGERLGTIPVPEVAANLNWAPGPSGAWNVLFITASTSVYRVETRVAGNRLGYMR
jgi:gluconolactonase